MEDLAMDLEVNDSLHINELPDVCLRHIFSFLPNLQRLGVERVCKRWRIIGLEGWPDVKKFVIVAFYSDNMLHQIFKRCGRFLRKLKILDLVKESIVFSLILKFCKLDQLTSIVIHVNRALEIKDVRIKICQLRMILKKTTKLVDLKYSGYLALGTWLHSLNMQTLQLLCIMNPRRGLISINPDDFPNLKKLSLETVKIEGDEARREKESLKGLEIIEMKKCLIPQDFIERIETFENLQKLTLGNCTYDMTNNHIRNIALHCCKLKEMHLSGSFNMTSECFKYLGMIPSLEILVLAELDNVNSHDIAYLKNVNHLYFYYCTGDFTGDGTIELIAESTNLEYLRLCNIGVLNMTFLNDIRQIFHRNLRKKPLKLDVYATSLNSDDTPEVIDHPSLKLNVHVSKS